MLLWQLETTWHSSENTERSLRSPKRQSGTPRDNTQTLRHDSETGPNKDSGTLPTEGTHFSTILAPDLLREPINSGTRPTEGTYISTKWSIIATRAPVASKTPSEMYVAPLIWSWSSWYTWYTGTWYTGTHWYPLVPYGT